MHVRFTLPNPASLTACAFLVGLPLALSAAESTGADPASTAGVLEAYVNAPDASTKWTVDREFDFDAGGKAIVVKLVSQTWHGIKWEHWVGILRPGKVTRSDTALLWIAGGSSPGSPPTKLSGEARRMAEVATATGTVVAVITQVPNQPLFGGLHEDALIAYTFEKCFETKDPTWPCLLPMTKSAVRAMDAVQAVLTQKFSAAPKRFVVTGASKRGWTTWLTAAVDPRVAAIAPQVIDVLNMPEQMPLQRKSFGGYSEKIEDYTERRLQDRLLEPEGRALVAIIDPYAYRKKLTMPKLILLGTNDPYWPVDAATLYFDGLAGEKQLHYVPNAGHGLGPGAMEALAAFYSNVVEEKARPRFTWKFSREGGAGTLAIRAEDLPVRAEFWQAENPTRDFRKAKWSSTPLEAKEAGKFERTVKAPEKGFAAVFARLVYPSPLRGEYTLATEVEVLGD